jgi:hypothetical protein
MQWYGAPPGAGWASCGCEGWNCGVCAQSLELLQLTFGAVVARLAKYTLSPAASPGVVSDELRTMGQGIGERLADDFFASRAAVAMARTGGAGTDAAALPRCSTFRDAMQSLAALAIPQYLGVAASVANWTADYSAADLVLESDPLCEFLEVPPALEGLRLASLLAGAVEGGLKAVRFSVVAAIVKDQSAGDARTEIRVELKEIVADAAGDEYAED